MSKKLKDKDMTLHDTERELAEIKDKLKPLVEREAVLQRLQRHLLDVRWVAANKVTRDDVEMSEGDDIPYFSQTSTFVEWMKKHPTNKRFVEWNSRVYFKSDFLQGGLPYDSSAGLSEVPE